MTRYIVACLPFGFFIFLKYSPHDKTELRTANFAVSMRQAPLVSDLLGHSKASKWMPSMVPFFVAQFLSHFAMENWPAIFYMFHPPKASRGLKHLKTIEIHLNLIENHGFWPQVPLFGPHSHLERVEMGVCRSEARSISWTGASSSRFLADPRPLKLPSDRSDP